MYNCILLYIGLEALNQKVWRTELLTTGQTAPNYLLDILNSDDLIYKLRWSTNIPCAHLLCLMSHPYGFVLSLWQVSVPAVAVSGFLCSPCIPLPVLKMWKQNLNPDWNSDICTSAPLLLSVPLICLPLTSVCSRSPCVWLPMLSILKLSIGFFLVIR